MWKIRKHTDQLQYTIRSLQVGPVEGKFRGMDVVRVVRFKEKPSAEAAGEYVHPNLSISAKCTIILLMVLFLLVIPRAMKCLKDM